MLLIGDQFGEVTVESISLTPHPPALDPLDRDSSSVML